MLFCNNMFPALETERMLLRKPSFDDTDDIYILCSDPAACKYADWRPHSDRTVSRSYIAYLKKQALRQNVQTYTWFAEEKQSHRVIGTFSVVETDYSGKIVTIGYTLSGEFQHKGFATEAVNRMLKFLFLQRGVERVQAKVMPQNAPSVNLLERLGFLKEGLVARGAYCKGRCVDVFLFGITRPVFEQRGKELLPNYNS